jgi:hypothetical protein
MMQRRYRKVDDHKVKVVEAKIQRILECLPKLKCCLQGV